MEKDIKQEAKDTKTVTQDTTVANPNIPNRNFSKDSRPPMRGGRRPQRSDKERVKPEFDTKIIGIRRVTRVASGGRRFTFSVAVVSGDLKGKTIPMFKFNEKGTLVSLSESEAVGQILGNTLVQGPSARIMYRSLYRIHQSKIHGVGKTLLITAKDAFARQVNPRIKFF